MTPASAPAAEVFVLNDDPVTAGLIKEILVRGGYSVQTFRREDIRRLVEQFRRPSSRARVLIARAMNGKGVSAARDCRDLDPELKVIIISGILFQWKLRVGSEDPAFPDVWLGMPFRPDVLLEAVNRVLSTQVR